MKTLKKSLVPHVAKDSTESTGLPSCGSRVFFMEQWKAIKDYEGIYEISDQGRVKSLKRIKIQRDGVHHPIRERIRKQNQERGGYLLVGLTKKCKTKVFVVHLLVWDHFGDRPRNGRIIQVDHKNEVKTDNRIENLQLLTARENCIKYTKTKRSASKYTGLYWHKKNKKWVARIYINRRIKNLGCFTDEFEAHQAYQNELKKILQNGQN